VIRKIIKQHRIAYVRKDCHGNPISSNLNQKKLSDYVRKHPKETQTKIAAHFGCDPSCVSRAIKKYDIPYVRYYSNNIDAKKLEEFARKNPFASARQIARTFDMPAVCVANALSRYGISEKKNVWKAEAIQAYIRTHPNTRKQEMARHFGVSPSAFSRRLKRYGIKF
jgi:DNA-binding MarR family transcriptional regulator